MSRLSALIKKEFFQIIRDPSSIMIAFVMPLMLLLIYMYGVNLDTSRIKLGLKFEDMTPELSTLVNAFNSSKFVRAAVYDNKELMYEDLTRGRLNGFVVIPNNFMQDILRKNTASVQIVTDGSEVNLSNYTKSYPSSIIRQWFNESVYENTEQMYKDLTKGKLNGFVVIPNNFMKDILRKNTANVQIVTDGSEVTREWERGTMEAVLSTHITKTDIILSKYIPYFILGMISMAFNVFVCVAIFKIPFRGSYFILFFVSSMFLFSSLGIGLFISSNFKDQFLASQSALSIGFLPSLLLSGLTFPISSMPQILQEFTKIIPTKYFVTFIQSEFLTGTIWQSVLFNAVFLFILGTSTAFIVYGNIKTRVE